MACKGCPESNYHQKIINVIQMRVQSSLHIQHKFSPAKPPCNLDGTSQAETIIANTSVKRTPQNIAHGAH